ncbi:MAG: glycosyltransferase [Alkalimonas sp.]|nr:glycosyltransferase [Alkalimonas sp.]
MKLLYGVQGTGNGHIARARAMAQALKKQPVQVDYLFSGRPAEQYFSMDDFGDYQCRQGLTFLTEQGRVRPVKTVLNSHPIQLLRDIKQLDLSGYDAVINDFEPISAWAARRQKVPCIGISHQNAFRYQVPKVGMTQLDKLVMQYFAPVDYAIGLHWHHFQQPILPPIVHQLDSDAIATEPYVLVYLPFESLPQIRGLLQRIKNQRFVCYHPAQSQHEVADNLSLHPLSHQNFQRHLQRCEGVIANGGFELPSEALSLGKKLLLKPLQGQFEQQSNVETLRQLGLATAMTELNAQTIIQWLQTKSAGQVQYPKVAEALAQWILDGNWDTTDTLRQQLWQQSRFPKATRLPGNPSNNESFVEKA